MYDEADRKKLILFGIAAGLAGIALFSMLLFLFRANQDNLDEHKKASNASETTNGLADNINADLFSQLQLPRDNLNGAAPIENNLPIENVATNNNNANASRPLAPPLLLPPAPPPPPVNMDRLKKQGCVADGILTGYSPENMQFIELINRSNCYYLHRAIETWLTPPDFSRAETRKKLITKKDLVFGMFIAEALDTKASYYNEKKNRDFDFSKMCHKGTANAWGEHTCRPAFSSEEYRDYVEQISRKAINLGVQSFTFGQIYWQEGSENQYAQEIIAGIRSYAKENSADVIIGAQTGSITDPQYLKLFDYIEGGVGIDGNGNIENGPCLSRRGGCWALLWHKNYANNANNVLLHLDWTGIPSDDLDIFARMSRAKRAQTLERLYNYFRGRNMGFMLPFFGVLYKNNGGCYGPEKKYYSPDNAYSCKDEDAINQIMK